jgi:hypothetical protein
VVEGVDQQHEQDERDRQARQQDSEAARAAFERRPARRLGERAREPAVEGVAVRSRRTSIRAEPVTTLLPMKIALRTRRSGSLQGIRLRPPSRPATPRR